MRFISQEVLLFNFMRSFESPPPIPSWLYSRTSRGPPRRPALENSRSYGPSKKKWKHWNLSNFLFYSENFCTAYILTHFLHTLEDLQLLKVYLSREKHQKQAPWNAQGLQNSWKKDAKKIKQFFFYSKILKNMFSLCVSLVLSHYSCFSSPCPIFLFLPTL